MKHTRIWVLIGATILFMPFSVKSEDNNPKYSGSISMPLFPEDRTILLKWNKYLESGNAFILRMSVFKDRHDRDSENFEPPLSENATDDEEQGATFLLGYRKLLLNRSKLRYFLDGLVGPTYRESKFMSSNAVSGSTFLSEGESKGLIGEVKLGAEYFVSKHVSIEVGVGFEYLYLKTKSKSESGSGGLFCCDGETIIRDRDFSSSESGIFINIFW